jgi:hypothetical protein
MTDSFADRATDISTAIHSDDVARPRMSAYGLPISSSTPILTTSSISAPMQLLTE